MESIPSQTTRRRMKEKERKTETEKKGKKENGEREKETLTGEIVFNRRRILGIPVDASLPSRVADIILHSVVVVASDRLLEQIVCPLI